MKFQMSAVLTLLAAFAVLEGTSRLVAQETTAPARRKALNPSSAFPPVNPSQAFPPVTQSQVFPQENPSRVIPPLGPSRDNRVTPPTDNGGFKQAPVNPLPVTTQVFIAIAEGPNQLRGLPSFGNAGLGVRNLRVETERGRVVLFGTVATEADRALAAVRAEEIVGTGKVVNKLHVSR